MQYRISVEFVDNYVIAIVGWTMGNGLMIAENRIISGTQYFAVQYRFAPLCVCVCARSKICHNEVQVYEKICSEATPGL